MWRGVVSSLHTAPAAGARMETHARIAAIAGRGISGDRYFLGLGTYSDKPGPGVDRQMTLIESETLAALARDQNIAVAPDQVRRNIVTTGVPLNHLVGREFLIGAVRVRGFRLCQPCAYLGELLDSPKIFNALLHRGGLNCEILEGGDIRTGDPVRPA